jgi:hypothetical protein
MMKRKIESLNDLKLEQARLRMEVNNSEEKIGERLDYLRANYPSILLMQVLPFDDSKKEMIVSGLGFALSLAMGKLAEAGKDILASNLQKFTNWITSKFGDVKPEN